MESLPAELVELVLLRVPMRSRVLARRVCKQWRALIPNYAHIGVLPEAVLEQVLLHLNVHSRARCRGVSSTWKRVLASRSLCFDVCGCGYVLPCHRSRCDRCEYREGIAFSMKYPGNYEPLHNVYGLWTTVHGARRA